MASGIRDKVAIIGMGCSRFGERWDCGAEDLMLEAFTEAAGAKARALLDKKLRATALKVLDFADRLAGKSGSTG